MLKTARILFALGLLVSTSQALAQDTPDAPPETPEEKIRDVSIQGNKRREQEAIFQEIRSKVGNAVDPEQIRKDIVAIYQLGFFDDVKVDLTDGVLTFIVTEKPAIGQVAVQGNNKINDDKVEEVIEIKPNDILDITKIKADEDKIRQLYLDKGYFLAEVGHEVEISEAGEANITFTINEHAKVLVRKISFVGNLALSDTNLKSEMSTKEGGFFSFINGNGTYKEDVFERDMFLITAKYWDEGYINAVIGDPKVTLSPDKTDIYITVSIEEGPRFTVGKIDFAGDLIESKELLAKKITMQTKQWFRRSAFSTDVQKLTSDYRDIGYAYANVTPKSLIHSDTKLVDITYEIQKGKQARFHRIFIKGNTRTRDQVIRREMKIFEGELYSETQLNQSRLSILRLGFFESVNISTTKGADGDTVDVNVEIKEKSTGTFQVGAGFSTLENFIATAQISQNNFLGRGQTLTFQAQLSTRRQLLDLRFFEPHFLGTKVSFAFSAFINQRLFQEFERASQGGDFTWGYQLSDNWRASAGYSMENVQLTLVENSLPNSLVQNGVTSAISSTISYDSRDNRLFTSAGWFHSLTAEFASGLLGANLFENQIEFTRFREVSRYFYPIVKSATPGGGVVLKFNMIGGYIVSNDPSEDVPVSERFFVGGINSVRGFEARSLGPKLKLASSPGEATSEVVIGGTGEFTLNSELEFPILNQAGIRGVIFMDAGNAFGGIRSVGAAAAEVEKDFGFIPLRTSVGFGFRWFSPIGPLRFEWGIPLDRKADEQPVVFEFTIGNFF
jgi:outer membrane protein insertion porin family